jgi:hypothetical protein
MTSTQKRLSTIRSNESKAWSCEGCGWSFVRLTVGETRSEAEAKASFAAHKCEHYPRNEKHVRETIMRTGHAPFRLTGDTSPSSR